MIPNLAATVLAFRAMQRNLKSIVKVKSYPKCESKDKPTQQNYKRNDMGDEIFIDQYGNKTLN